MEFKEAPFFMNDNTRTPAMNLPGLIPAPPMTLDRPVPEVRTPGTYLCPFCNAELYPGKGIRCPDCYNVLDENDKKNEIR